MDRPANDEMIKGFRDGYDRNAPEPGPNTTASYRHGFECGRDDIQPTHRRSGCWRHPASDLHV